VFSNFDCIIFELWELFCTFDCIVFGLRELCLVILTYLNLGNFVW
jgi:hypothetical protein